MSTEIESLLMDKSLEVEDLIAELCNGAPSEAVKFCLRNYRYDKNISQIQKDIEKDKAQTLKDTAQYLKVPKYNLKTKKSLAHLIICRIQNLLPETCTICKDRYSIGLLEDPILECSICGQGVHRECWFKLAEQATGYDKEVNLTADIFKSLFNPLNVPGLHYICNICEESTIPNEDEGNTKGLPKKGGIDKENAQTEMVDEQPSQNITSTALTLAIADDEVESENPPVTNPPETDTEVENLVDSDGDNVAPDKSQSNKSNTICHFFKNGSCKHGLKGKECRFSHPKMCQKFLKHGTRQPRGCNLGKLCKDFHPKMCITSLRKGECFSENCRYNHVKGTKRQPQRDGNQMNKDSQPSNETTAMKQGATNMQKAPSAETSPFLEMLRLFKAEILQTFDQKLTTITSQMTNLQGQPTNYNQVPMNMPIMRPQPPQMFMTSSQPFSQIRMPHLNL